MTHSQNTVVSRPLCCRDVSGLVPSRLVGLLALLLAAVVALPGCESTEEAPTPAAPAAAFSGDPYLRGTIGSLAKLRNYEPTLVSGYGLVVDLPNTGSPDAPAFIRQWLLNEMRKQGVGSAQYGAKQMSPQQLLASPTTTVVEIEGLIPPGATKGNRFDLLVRALPEDTQTTSLQGGRLWTADLAVGGANRQLRFMHPVGKARGAIYVNPFASTDTPQEQYELHRDALVIAGGVVSAERPLQLTLNQPSWQRSRLVADRINERFPARNGDRTLTAVAKTDLLIEINVPRRFGDNPEHLLSLIRYMFVQRAPGFTAAKAEQLGNTLVERPDQAAIVGYAWEALGKTALPGLRKHYQNKSEIVRLTALDAGVRLGDNLAVQPLVAELENADSQTRARIATMLGRLPANLSANRTVVSLLNDIDPMVRVAAYEALASTNDPVIQRTVIGGVDDPKFIFDLVPANDSMLFIDQTNFPRLAIFNKSTNIKSPSLAGVWNNQLMVRVAEESNKPMEVYYQAPGTAKGFTYKLYPTLANFVFLLGHETTVENPTDGLDLSYSEVVNALYELRQKGHLAADLEVRLSPLAKAVVRYKQQQRVIEDRPELEQTSDEEAPSEPVGTQAQAGSS